MEKAQGMEAADQSVKRLKGGDADQVHCMGASKGQRSYPKQAEKCSRCGSTDHAANACRFREATCHKCNWKGHITLLREVPA